MIELNSVVMILMVEALVALLLLCGWWLWRARKTKTQDFILAESLVDDIDDTAAQHSQKLAVLLNECCQLEESTKAALLKDIALHEKALYRLFVQLFLDRDTSQLKELQGYLFDLDKPYCKMLQYGSVDYQQAALDKIAPTRNQELEFANKEIVRLADENAVLSSQLQEALKTIENISEEYARVFNNTQNEVELRESAKKVLAVFQNTLDSLQEKATLEFKEDDAL